MQGFLKRCTAVFGRVIFIGFSIQIILGILWICAAFTARGNFGEGVVCVGQIFLLGIAVWFVQGAGLSWKKMFSVLSVLSFPFVLHCLMRPDLRVLVAIFWLLGLGCVFRMEEGMQRSCFEAGKQGKREEQGTAERAAQKEKEAGEKKEEKAERGERAEEEAREEKEEGEKKEEKAERGERAEGEVQKEKEEGEKKEEKAEREEKAGRTERTEKKQKHGRQWSAKGYWALTSILLVLGIVAGAMREPDTDMLMRAGSRMVWTTLYKEYERLPKETRDLIDYTELAESTYEATGIENVLLPSMERTMGKQESRAVLREMIALSWEYSKGRILKEIIWDEAGYLVTPLIFPLQLKGRAYESYSGLNYRQILQPAPRLGSFYVYYSCWWFGVAMLFRIFLWMMAGCPIRKKTGFYVVFTMLILSFWYTMSGAGKMDYRNTLYILCVWMIWLVSGAVAEFQEKAEYEGEGSVNRKNETGKHGTRGGAK